MSPWTKEMKGENIKEKIKATSHTHGKNATLLFPVVLYRTGYMLGINVGLLVNFLGSPDSSTVRGGKKRKKEVKTI